MKFLKSGLEYLKKQNVRFFYFSILENGDFDFDVPKNGVENSKILETNLDENGAVLILKMDMEKIEISDSWIEKFIKNVETLTKGE